MAQHFVKKHGKASYNNPALLHDDHSYEKGIADARSLYQHMVSKLFRGSHLCIIFSNLDVAGFITYKARVITHYARPFTLLYILR